MKEFKIQITDTDVYINGRTCKFDYLMDKENKEFVFTGDFLVLKV